jgi:ribosome-associated toxin RatA of RatAB toxin-antitoxin module
MLRVFRRTIVPHSVDHVLSVITDVSQYSKFLPLCTESVVHSRPTPTSMTASLTVGVPPLFLERYTSRVHWSGVKECREQQQREDCKGRKECSCPSTYRVEARSIEGKLITDLTNEWLLRPAGPRSTDVSCLVLVRYAGVGAAVVEAAMGKAARGVMDAFVARCAEVKELPQEPRASDLSPCCTPSLKAFLRAESERLRST